MDCLDLGPLFYRDGQSALDRDTITALESNATLPAMHGSLISCLATAVNLLSKLAILAGILSVGEEVTLEEEDPSPMSVWAVTQNS